MEGIAVGQKFYCRANLYDVERRRVFTAGKTYNCVELWPDHEAVEFNDDLNQRHMVSHDWLLHFDKL